MTEVMTNSGGEEGEQLVETIELLNKFSLPKSKLIVVVYCAFTVKLLTLLNSINFLLVVQSDEHNNGLVNQMTETKRITEDILALANKMESRHAAGSANGSYLVYELTESPFLLIYCSDLLSLLPVIDELLHNVGVARSGQFEWVDSLLVQAIKEGYWMLLSHANFCRYNTLNRPTV